MTPEDKTRYREMIKEALMEEVSQKILYGDESTDTVFSDRQGGQFRFRERIDAALKDNKMYEMLDGATGGLCSGESVESMERGWIRNLISNLDPLRKDDIVRPPRPAKNIFPKLSN